MARWTDLAQWQGPTPNEGDGDGRPGEPTDRMTGHIGLVVHIAEGTYEGTESWERNPVAQVSSHFVAAKDGRIAQMVDTDDRSWCQADGNSGWISVENEGVHTDTPTAGQIEALAQLYARCMQVYKMPARITDSVSTGGLGWHGMGGLAWGGHFQCPGEGFKAERPAILARAIQIMGGGPATGGDDMLADERAAVLNAAAFAYACEHGAETVFQYDSATGKVIIDLATGKGKLFPMAPYWARIAAEVAKLGGPGPVSGHNHPGGETGPAQPIAPAP